MEDGRRADGKKTVCCSHMPRLHENTRYYGYLVWFMVMVMPMQQSTTVIWLLNICCILLITIVRILLTYGLLLTKSSYGWLHCGLQSTIFRHSQYYELWYLCIHAPSASDVNHFFTALHVMQTGLARRILSVRPSVCPSVRLSVTRVYCDKRVKRSVQIYIPYERTFILVFWEEEWLVGGDPF